MLAFICENRLIIIELQWLIYLFDNWIKARVYNPGELTRELARFESGTSSKFHLCRPKPLPHKLERASVSGTQQGEGDAGARRSNLAEFSMEQTGSQDQNIKLHSGTFQNKTLRVDTSTNCEASCLLYCAVVDSGPVQATALLWKCTRIASLCLTVHRDPENAAPENALFWKQVSGWRKPKMHPSLFRVDGESAYFPQRRCHRPTPRRPLTATTTTADYMLVFLPQKIPSLSCNLLAL